MNMLEKAVKYAYSIGADHYYKRFLRDTVKAGDINRSVLTGILTGNAQTIYARSHRFADIKNSKANVQ